MVNELRLCACGCGASVTSKVKTVRFKWGHHRRNQFKRMKETVVTYRTQTVDGESKHVHRVRAEKALGKPLPLKAVVHHVDGSRSEHSPLVICQDQKYHFLLHIRARVIKAGGNPNTDKLCSGCRLPKPLSQFVLQAKATDGRFAYCRECMNARNLAYRIRQRA